jgi:hypothetical protein
MSFASVLEKTLSDIIDMAVYIRAICYSIFLILCFALGYFYLICYTLRLS